MDCQFSHVKYEDAFTLKGIDHAVVMNSMPSFYGKNYKPPKKDMVEDLQNKYISLLNKISDYTGGKIQKTPSNIEYYEWLCETLPAEFETDIKSLDKYDGELSVADIAWIKNTRELMKRWGEKCLK